jgi:hypothetical protein
MADKDIRMLVEAIVDYLQWERSIKADGLHRPLIRDSFALIDFLRFTTSRDMVWEDMFTPHTLKEFSHVSTFKHPSRTFLAVSSFLASDGRGGLHRQSFKHLAGESRLNQEGQSHHRYDHLFHERV